MSELEVRLLSAEDKFRFVLERPECVQDSASFGRLLTAADRAAEIESCCLMPTTASVELALIRLERMRYNLDYEKTCTALDDIEERAARSSAHPAAVRVSCGRNFPCMLKAMRLLRKNNSSVLASGSEIDGSTLSLCTGSERTGYGSWTPWRGRRWRKSAFKMQ